MGNISDYRFLHLQEFAGRSFYFNALSRHECAKISVARLLDYVRSSVRTKLSVRDTQLYYQVLLLGNHFAYIDRIIATIPRF